MADNEPSEDAQLFPRNVGERLREAREAKGMALSDVAEKTRIPLRHLESIETAQYNDLPSTTYALGFAKAYARIVGLDEVAIARDLHIPTVIIPRFPAHFSALGMLMAWRRR